MSSTGQAASAAGGAIEDLFGSSGSASAASAYSEAATIAQSNELTTRASTQVQEDQAGIAIFKALGTERADVAGAGFTPGGSAGDLMRSSALQAALSKTLIEDQGSITAKGYAEQASAYGGQAEAAQAQGQGQVVGGILQGISAISDLGGLGKIASGIGAAVSGVGTALGIGGGVATSAVAGSAAAIAAGSDTVLASGLAADGVTDAAAGAAAGGGILDTVGTALSFLAWVICTELMKQGRMPMRYWKHGSKVFNAYPTAVKEGYYVWAVPSVRHLRDHPRSFYSRFLCTVFNWRAENIAAAAGVVGARRLLRGAAITAALWPLCYCIGAVLIMMRHSTDWKALYAR